MNVRILQAQPHPETGLERASRVAATVGLLPILLVLMVLFMAVVEQKFFGMNNLFNVLRSTSFLAIIAAGQMLVLIVGGFDLSVGAVIALTSTVMAKAMALLSAAMPDQTAAVIILGVLAGLGCGVFIGLINGLCVAFLRISPFMVTLGTLSIATGIGLLLTNGIPVYGMPDVFVKEFGRALWFGLPATVYVAVALIAIVWFIQQRTRLGRYIYAIGGNLQAATVSGVPATGYLVLTYVMCSVLASITGILMTARLGSGQATMGGNVMMLQSIAAAVIAGVSLRGGIGRVELVALGALFLSILTNAMNLLRIDSKMQLVVLGIIVVAAVALDELGKRRRVRD
ncbi:ABC transporter permease [Microbaculum marinum]|uniref:ABC transporter permease n=1 Tax=Microbaculum marinum TaxID=1764581 RepID=A0AAW9RR70_9HYPH